MTLISAVFYDQGVVVAADKALTDRVADTVTHTSRKLFVGPDWIVAPFGDIEFPDGDIDQLITKLMPAHQSFTVQAVIDIFLPLYQRKRTTAGLLVIGLDGPGTVRCVRVLSEGSAGPHNLSPVEDLPPEGMHTFGDTVLMDRLIRCCDPELQSVHSRVELIPRPRVKVDFDTAMEAAAYSVLLCERVMRIYGERIEITPQGFGRRLPLGLTIGGMPDMAVWSNGIARTHKS